MTNRVIKRRFDAFTQTPTLPLFPTLIRKPGRPDHIFLIAWFAHHQHLTGQFVPGARRDIQLFFRRTSGSDVSQWLTNLVDGTATRGCHSRAQNGDVPFAQYGTL